jgi:hypothetical protein
MTPLTQPIQSESVWTGQDLQRDRSWEFTLSSRQKATSIAPCKRSTSADYSSPKSQNKFLQYLHWMRPWIAF